MLPWCPCPSYAEEPESRVRQSVSRADPLTAEPAGAIGVIDHGDGVECRFQNYTNIDPHGHMRGVA